MHDRVQFHDSVCVNYRDKTSTATEASFELARNSLPFTGKIFPPMLIIAFLWSRFDTPMWCMHYSSNLLCWSKSGGPLFSQNKKQKQNTTNNTKTYHVRLPSKNLTRYVAVGFLDCSSKTSSEGALMRSP